MLCVSDEQLLGRKPCQNDVTFINDGRVRTPPRTGSGKNRVGPAANALGPGGNIVVHCKIIKSTMLLRR